jgi:hypothetical protein
MAHLSRRALLLAMGVGPSVRVVPFNVAEHDYVGVVATRCRIPTDQTVGTGGHGYTDRSYHFARDDITAISLGYMNWFANYQKNEVSNCDPVRLTGSIEYPENVLYQLTWGGSPSVVVPPGDTLISDLLPVKIPRNGRFYRRLFVRSLGNHYSIINSSAYPNTTLVDFTGGDVFDLTGTDLTMGGEMVNAGPQNQTPTLLIGTTTRPTIAIVGDSRDFGAGDMIDVGIGDSGQTARAIGPYFAYINLGVYGDQAAFFVAGSSLRRAMLEYCSHIICGYGINDITDAGKSSQVVEACLENVYRLPGIAGKPIFQNCLLPVSASRDGWTTISGQTTDVHDSDRRAVNNWIKDSSTSGIITGYIDPCITIESTRPGGLWNVPGLTLDGVHPTQTGYARIASAAVSGSARFHQLGQPQ